MPVSTRRQRKVEELYYPPNVPIKDVSLGERKSQRTYRKKPLTDKIKTVLGTAGLAVPATAAAALGSAGVLGTAAIPTVAAMLFGGPLTAIPALGASYAIGRSVAKGVKDNVFDKLRTQSMKTYEKNYDYNREIDKSRMNEVLIASEFMLNTYDNNHEMAGWYYSWFNYGGQDVGYYASHVDVKTKRKQIVFAFRGTNSLTDVLADANASHAETIKEWGGIPLRIPITAAAGFLHRLQDISDDLNYFIGLINGYYEDYILENANREASEEKEERTPNLFDDRYFYSQNEDIPENRLPGYDDVTPLSDQEIEEMYTDSMKRFNERKLQGKGETNDTNDRTSGKFDWWDYEIDDILITGHSLGGAVATIFAVILGQILPPELAVRIRLITFEPARSLRKSTVSALMADPIMANIARNAIFITNGLDPVPQVPFRGEREVLASGFQHFGVSWYIPPAAMDGVGWLDAHGSQNVVNSLKTTRNLGIPNSRLYVSNGSGMRKKKSSSSSSKMKAKMAYVRSFKRS